MPKCAKAADDAPLIERVEYVNQTQINPQLANHGGSIAQLKLLKMITQFYNSVVVVIIVKRCTLH